MGIFYKDCPQCAATHASSASTSGCGYVFHGDMLQEPDLAPELAAQDEKLYQAYLAARLEQCISDAENAEADARADPGNTHKTQRAREMIALVDAARADLKAQTAKTADAVRLADIAKTQRGIKSRTMGKPDRRPVAKPATPAHTESAKHHKQMQTDRKSTKQAIAAAKAIQTTQVVNESTGDAEQAARAQAFHTAQTAKANQAMKALQAAKVREQAAKTNEAGALFKAHQAARAAQIMRTETKDCPNCTATLLLNVRECRCGFTFSGETNEMPGLSLSPREQAELLRQAK